MTALIAGLVRFDGAAARPWLDAMLRAMAPEGCDIRLVALGEGAVALGALTAAPGGLVPEPPLAVETADALTVADLRLYDDPDLGTALAAGPDGPAALHGDFAIARWDRQARRLTLWRDHFGLRPLHWVYRPGEWFAFASRPGVLLRAGFASRRTDPEALAEIVETGLARAPATAFAEIRALEPATRLTLTPGEAPVTARYWRPVASPVLPAARDGAEEAAEIRALLDRAVRRRLPDRGVPAGHLSGGLDSGAISVLASRAAAEAGRGYRAYGFCAPPGTLPAGMTDEGPSIRAVAAGCPGLTLIEVAMPPYLDCLEGHVDPDTGLCTHPAYAPEAALADAAGAGAPLLLSGWGGDEGVSAHGAGAHLALAREGEWRLLLAELRAFSARSGRSVAALALHRVGRLALPLGLRRGLRRALIGAEPLSAARTVRRRFLRPDLRTLAPEPWRIDGPDTQANRIAALEKPLMAARLDAMAQHAARHGLAFACPMLDRDLVAHVLRLPEIAFIRGGVPRAPLRRAMAGLMPEPVLGRIAKFAPFPAERAHAAATRPRMVAALDRLGRDPAVAAVLDTDAIAGYLRAGVTAGLDHIPALQLAFFLAAQGRA